MPEERRSNQQGLSDFVRARIERLRPKLLDLSRRNPLISTRLSSSALVRSVDELPDFMALHLFSGEKKLLFRPLPSLDQDPRDEQSRRFQNALAQARLTEAEYLVDLKDLSSRDDEEEAAERERDIERRLRDRLRAQLGMEPRQSREGLTLGQHARNNNIAPSFELPMAAHRDGRHGDDAIQTLLLPADLERKLSAILTKARTWAQETGINVLHAAFGFLEWQDSTASEPSFAPLILVPIEIERVKTASGYEFWMRGVGEPEANLVLAEKLKADFGIALPPVKPGSVEQYWQELGRARLPPKWKVRRQVAFGIFPSARMAMFIDLDTASTDIERHEIVRKLLGGAPGTDALPFADEYHVDEPEIESKVPFLVLDADSSQFSTLVDVCSGQSVAVEGPPGTGKSQTIVNIIAAAIADRKKVLFVAEKAAALDVVKSRLEAVGLGEFVLPLQADRSTREAVIGSVRNRLSMAPAQTPRDLRERMEHLKRSRAQINSYINTLGSTFAQTGYTVYDILGKSIVTGPLLDQLPQALVGYRTLEVGHLTAATIDKIKSIGGAIEDARSEMEQGLPHWRGIRLESVDRFTVEHLLNLAQSASTALSELSRALQQIHEFGFDPAMTAEERSRDAVFLLELASRAERVDASLVERLYSSGSGAYFSEFLELCRRYKSAGTAILGHFNCAIDATLSRRLRDLHRLCEQWRIPGLGAKERQAWLLEFETALAVEKSAFNALADFVGLFPALQRVNVDRWKAARALVLAYDSQVLALRSQSIADVAVFRLARQLVQTGKSLRDRKAKINAIVLVDIASPAREMREHAAALRRSSWLSFLSRKFRSARHFYATLARHGDVSPVDAARHLSDLAELREALEAFENDKASREIFGLHFRGVDTDFERFEQVLSFLEAVEERFSSVQDRHLWRFLREESASSLRSIPPLSDPLPNHSFEVLAERVRQHENELQLRRSALDEIASLTALLAQPEQLSLDRLPKLADEIDAILSLRAATDDHAIARDALQTAFEGSETPVEKYEQIPKLMELLQARADIGRNALFLLKEGQLQAAAAALRNASDVDLNSAGRSLHALSEASGVDFAARLSPLSLLEARDLLKAAAADSAGVFANARYNNACRELEQYGLGLALGDLVESKILPRNLPRILEALIFRSMALKVQGQYGAELFRYSGTALNDLRREFAELDREVIALSRAALRAQAYAAASPPQGIGVGRKSEFTEMSLLQNEVSKTKRFVAVRDLTRRAGRALQELKPCWMMSPLAVAQYLPRGGITFDICIIDEASQMPPEDAIGALGRCAQAVVVGDTNQLPPTSFFKKVLDEGDGEDADEAVVEESILEIANGVFRPGRRLRWHYRSRHSGLIQFSNKHVYDNNLVVFPSASEDRPNMGVSLVSVQGNYKSSVNLREAEIMVQAIIEFMRTDTNRSLGVVTLNQPQRELLEAELNAALEQDVEAANYVEEWKSRNDGLEAFFIKNLENVQGDERDVIFIGTVYGPSERGGPVMQRFGPINGVAGKRRLNVLFSRAKEQIVTFSSMTAADIRAEENGNAGVYLLQQWLAYSATGVIEGGKITHREPDSDFERYVAAQVRAIGCTAVPQVGAAGYFIDIGVRHPNWPHGFIMGIECDGAPYHTSKSARDRDRLREEVLKRLGWKLHRIWSTDWFNDPKGQAERLRKTISDRLRELNADTATDPLTNNLRPVGGSIALASQGGPTSIGDDAQEGMRDPSLGARVEVGDTVTFRYLSGSQFSVTVTISAVFSDANRGVIKQEHPLAVALLGSEEGEEVEVMIGSTVRKALVERVVKATQRAEQRVSPAAPTRTPRVLPSLPPQAVERIRSSWSARQQKLTEESKGNAGSDDQDRC